MEKEKALGKMEVKDPELKKQVEGLISKKEEVCDNMRIYDFPQMMSKKPQIAVQCLYEGTIHQPYKACFGDFRKCPRVQSLEKLDEIMGRKGNKRKRPL